MSEPHLLTLGCNELPFVLFAWTLAKVIITVAIKLVRIWIYLWIVIGERSRESISSLG